MAYRSYLKYYGAGNQATVMSDTSTYLQAIGWTQEKAVSASRHFLSTVGEDGTHTKFWIDLQVSGNYVYIIPYSFIDTGTDTGYGGNYAASNVSLYRIDCSAAGYLRLYGSEDMVYFEYSSSGTVPAPSTSNCQFFGVVPHDQVVPRPWATTANAEVAGAGVTIEVDDTDGFQRNDYYQIFDPSTGCRERIQVTGITAGASVVATLANNYAAGSIIAYLPMSGFSMAAGSSRNSLYPCLALGVSGSGNCSTSNGTWGWSANGIAFTQYGAAPRNNLYQLIPYFFYGVANNEIATGVQPMIGYCHEDMLLCQQATVGDTIGCVDAGNIFSNGTATAGGAATMTDGGASWGVDALIGKILVLTGGTGAGQTRWITTNTATQITVGQNWVTQPVAGTTYMLVDDVYRCLGATGAYQALRETFGQP